MSMEGVGESLRYLAKRSNLSDGIEERVDKISRIISRRIGEEVVLIGIGSAGKEELQNMTTCLRSRGLIVEPQKISIVDATETDYGKVSLPEDQRVEGINPNGLPIVLFDHSIGSGDTANGTLKWALENAEKLNLDTVSFLALRDEAGFANITLNPSFVSEYKGPRTSFLNRLQHDPRSHQRLRKKVERHVNGKVYTFGRNSNWREKLRHLERASFIEVDDEGDGAIIFHDNDGKVLMPAIRIARAIKDMGITTTLDFINGYPAEIYVLEDFVIDVGLKAPLYTPRAHLNIHESQSRLRSFFGYNIHSLLKLLDINSFYKDVDYKGLLGDYLGKITDSLLTDRKVLLISDKFTDNEIQFAKALTQQGYRDYDNFRLVIVDLVCPFRIYTVSDIFRETFDRDLHLTPEDLGQDVEEYVSKELKSGDIPERYRDDLRVVTDKSARVYGLGLALFLGGNRKDRYFEIDSLDRTRLPTGPIHHVTLDRVKELRKQQLH